MLSPLEIIAAKRTHAARLATQAGAAGEQAAIAATDQWVARPKGMALRLLLDELAATGIRIKASRFDAIAIPAPVDFLDPNNVRAHLPSMTFIEIKTANAPRVAPGFGGFFFALTESEIAAADQLGDRHRVALFNKSSGEILLTSVPAIIARAKSMTWQLSLQL